MMLSGNRASTPNSRDVTPGLSLPVRVISSVVRGWFIASKRYPVPGRPVTRGVMNSYKVIRLPAVLNGPSWNRFNLGGHASEGEAAGV
jgi:hypothetical protein